MTDAVSAPRMIGDYILERELGRGGMGVVYGAAHSETGERVALKVISPHLLPGLRQRRRFRLEATAAARLQHPGFVRVLGYGEDSTTQPYILMEYLDGCSLRSALLHAPFRRLPSELAAQVALQLADALGAAHEAGLIHRDIKPSNIMLLDDPAEPSGWRVKLLDFGLAKLVSGDAEATITEGEILGTPAYMSPEQCEGRAGLDGRSDVYALGSLLYEMLCGRTPFVGDSPRIMFQHVYEPPDSPRKLHPPITPGLTELVLQMLAKEPASRPSAVQVKARLRLHLDKVPEKAVEPSAGSTRSPFSSLFGIGLLGLCSGAVLESQLRPQAGVVETFPERGYGPRQTAGAASPELCASRDAELIHGWELANDIATAKKLTQSHLAPFPARQRARAAAEHKKALDAPRPPNLPAAATLPPEAAPTLDSSADSKAAASRAKVEYWD